MTDGGTAIPPTVADSPLPARRAGWRPSANRWALLAVPGAALLAVVFVYPTVEILLRSVSEFLPPETGGMDNFRWFFDTSVNLEILRRTVTLAVLVTLLCLVIGYPYAYLMTLAGPRLRLLLLGVVLVSVFFSLLVRSYSWVILLQTNGPINDVIAALGFGRAELYGTTTGVVLAMTQILVPFMILPLYANLIGIDRRLLLAAESLGARPSVAFLRAYLPLSLPGVLAGSLLVFVITLGFYITPTLVGSPQNAILSQAVVSQISQLLAFGRAGAISVALLLLTLVVLAIVARISRSRLRNAGEQAAAGQMEDFDRGRLGRRLLALAGLAGALWMIVPSLIVIPISFTGEASLNFPPESWSTDWYSKLFTDPAWTEAIGRTFAIAALTTALVTVLGTATAFGLVRGRFPGKNLLNAVVLAPLIVPLVITAIGIYAVFLEWRLVGSWLGFILAHTVLALPFVVVTVTASLRTFDRSVEHAAASLGATPVKTFLTVTLPGIRSGVIGGAILAFATSFDETVISLFLATAEFRTLPVQIYNGITRQVDPTVAAASTLILVATVAALGLAAFVQGKEAKRAIS